MYGMPQPPTTHPASPQRAQDICTECNGTGHSPRRHREGSGSPYSPGSPVGMARSQPVYIPQGISGYRVPSVPITAVPPSAPVYDSPVIPISGVQYVHSVSPEYTRSMSGSPHLSGAGSPPPPGIPLAGDGESPRRIRAWGAPHSIRR
eukprot:TRINITY_DN10530_c1_g1_i1.p1 TRINITY_DN10530_c1_g1~~TRINITY_DN10530_c1_g1_i1.p1  ORF type:complete len:148 (+),score=16.29 TRINITY_DN10530_c1_g1_i1:53-496(+)